MITRTGSGHLLCAFSKFKVHNPFLFTDKNITGVIYLDTLENLLILKSKIPETDSFQTRPQPYFRADVWKILNNRFPDPWICRTGPTADHM